MNFSCFPIFPPAILSFRRFSICFIIIFGIAFIPGVNALWAEPVRKEVRWQEVPYSGGYIVEVVDRESGSRLIYQRVARPPFFFELDNGAYRLRILTLNRWEQAEISSDWVLFRIEPPLLASELTPEPEEVALPAQPQQAPDIGPGQIQETAEPEAAPALPDEPETDLSAPHYQEGAIIVPLLVHKGLSPFQSYVRDNFYGEVFLLNRPVRLIGLNESNVLGLPVDRLGFWGLWEQDHLVRELPYRQHEPFYFPLLRFRAGWKNLLLKGLYLSIQSEFFALSAMTVPDRAAEVYRSSPSHLHSLNISYRLPLKEGLDLVTGIQPLGLMYRILGISNGKFGVGALFVGPLGYIASSEMLNPALLLYMRSQNDLLGFYISAWDLLWGASLGLQYSAGKHMVWELTVYARGSYRPFALIDWGLEASAGFRL